jgi:hypothetical protein
VSRGPNLMSVVSRLSSPVAAEVPIRRIPLKVPARLETPVSRREICLDQRGGPQNGRIDVGFLVDRSSTGEIDFSAVSVDKQHFAGVVREQAEARTVFRVRERADAEQASKRPESPLVKSCVLQGL